MKEGNMFRERINKTCPACNQPVSEVDPRIKCEMDDFFVNKFICQSCFDVCVDRITSTLDKRSLLFFLSRLFFGTLFKGGWLIQGTVRGYQLKQSERLLLLKMEGPG